MVVATIWCAIAGVAGNVFSVKVDENDSVDDLKTAIQSKNRSTITCDPYQLHLFLAKKDGGNWLSATDAKGGVGVSAHMKELDDEYSRLCTSGLSAEEVVLDDQIKAGLGEVHVLVKLPTAKSIRLQSSAELDQYSAVAEKLKDSKGVTDLVKIIKTIHDELKVAKPAVMPFVVLENSSGTGKTQMAFNLQATGECDVFHMLCTTQGEDRQPVYDAFLQRSEVFRACIEADAEKLKEGSVADFVGAQSLLVYGFIIAALRGMDEFSGLEATRENVQRVLAMKTDKPFAFFLDEFPRVGNLKKGEMEQRKKLIRMIRNVFRSFHIVIVTSATNGTARDLLNTGKSSRTKSLRGETRWCVVVPALPEFIFTENMELEPWLLWILQHSRPLFAFAALQYIEKNPFRSSGRSRVEYLTDMARELVGQFRDLKQSSAALEFELGQFCMLFCISYKEIDRRVNLIDGHYGCLQEVKPFTLVLSGIRKGLFKLIESADGSPEGKRLEKWDSRCRLPLPEEDMLLHLTLMNDECLPTEDGNAEETIRPLEYAVHEEWQEIKVPYDMSNTTQRSNDGMTLEGLVAAAVVLASHRGGFYGVRFPEFLGRLLYELGVEKDPECVKQLPNQLKQDTMIPFLSMPNTKWPVEFLQDWHGSDAMFANMHRTANAERIDFAVPSSKIDVDQAPSNGDDTENESNDSVLEKKIILSGECKDREPLVLSELKKVLARVPKLTSIHLMTVQELQGAYFSRKTLTECTEPTQSTAQLSTAKKSAAKRTGSTKIDQADASSTSETNAPTDQVAAAPKPAASEPMSASQYLEHVDLQHADFYRISRSGEVQEFRELMDAKAVDDGTGKGGAGKLILFVEVGAISNKRRSGEAGQAESKLPPKKYRLSGKNEGD